MSSDVGIVCGTCDWFNPREGAICDHCGNDLSLTTMESALFSAPTDEELGSVSAVSESSSQGDDASGETVVLDEAAQTALHQRVLDDERVAAARQRGVSVLQAIIIGAAQEQEPKSGSEELQMEQARHYICKSCYSPIPGGHKFCGKCGAPTNFADDFGSTQYFGAMQVPNKAKLILIKGEGLDGISYHLNSTEHAAGREHGAILFPDDSWLSPRHANFFYRDNNLFVRDEESVNGVYIRIREPTTLPSGGMFMCGEQVFRVEDADALSDGAEADGTYFYASPTKNWSFRVVQILAGGVEGIVFHDEGGKVTIGREDCQMNFLQDNYMSPKHVEVSGSSGQFTVTDLDSQNGTFVRIEEERSLVHGDYLFLGKQMLRVEVTP